MHSRPRSSVIACCMPAGTLHTQALPREVRQAQRMVRGQQRPSSAPRSRQACMPQPWSSQVLRCQESKVHGNCVHALLLKLILPLCLRALLEGDGLQGTRPQRSSIRTVAGTYTSGSALI